MDRLSKISQQVVGSTSPLVAELKELGALFRDGLLSESEFASAKTQLLGVGSGAKPGGVWGERWRAPAGSRVSPAGLVEEGFSGPR